MMQRINDLLALLEMLLQIEQVHPVISPAPARNGCSCNKILAEQLGGLKAELERVEYSFRIEFAVEPGSTVNPQARRTDRRTIPVITQRTDTAAMQRAHSERQDHHEALAEGRRQTLREERLYGECF